jgi:hypothetical protein
MIALLKNATTVKIMLPHFAAQLVIFGFVTVAIMVWF